MFSYAFDGHTHIHTYIHINIHTYLNSSSFLCVIICFGWPQRQLINSNGYIHTHTYIHTHIPEQQFFFVCYHTLWMATEATHLSLRTGPPCFYFQPRLKRKRLDSHCPARMCVCVCVCMYMHRKYILRSESFDWSNQKKPSSGRKFEKS